MEHGTEDSTSPWASLTPRESELLKKAGERVFDLSRRLAEKEREAIRLTAETNSLRDLLAESREVRNVLVAQVTSLQTELDREYEERSELRRLLASLHVQMQELLPVVTGLSRIRTEAPAPQHTNGQRPALQRGKKRRGFAGRMVSAAQGEFQRLSRGPARNGR